MNLNEKSLAELLELHVNINSELRDREVLRSANTPTGDLAEYLFCKAFEWEQAKNSVKSYDATDKAGKKYQIKGRRLHALNSSRQLSALRNLKDGGFDSLAGIIFDCNYKILRAAIIPHRVVLSNSTYVAHSNSHRFLLKDYIWEDKAVVDVTSTLKKVLSGIK